MRILKLKEHGFLGTSQGVDENGLTIVKVSDPGGCLNVAMCRNLEAGDLVAVRNQPLGNFHLETDIVGSYESESVSLPKEASLSVV